MTLSDLIQQPTDLQALRGLALVFNDTLKALLDQAQADASIHFASPVQDVSGQWVLCADLLTEIDGNGLFARGFGRLPQELFPLVQVVPMSEINFPKQDTV